MNEASQYDISEHELQFDSFCSGASRIQLSVIFEGYRGGALKDREQRRYKKKGDMCIDMFFLCTLGLAEFPSRRNSSSGSSDYCNRCQSWIGTLFCRNGQD